MSYPELKRGDRGEGVFQLQSFLNRVGAMLTADGDFGSSTELGVRYAQDYGCQPVTGTADAPLWTWLESRAKGKKADRAAWPRPGGEIFAERQLQKHH